MHLDSWDTGDQGCAESLSGPSGRGAQSSAVLKNEQAEELEAPQLTPSDPLKAV